MHVMHISADVQRITLNASCMTISGRTTEQLNIFCRVTCFMSDFLSFVVVEYIWFFHGAFQWRNTDKNKTLHDNEALHRRVLSHWLGHSHMKSETFPVHGINLAGCPSWRQKQVVVWIESRTTETDELEPDWGNTKEGNTNHIQLCMWHALH